MGFVCFFCGGDGEGFGSVQTKMCPAEKTGHEGQDRTPLLPVVDI